MKSGRYDCIGLCIGGVYQIEHPAAVSLFAQRNNSTTNRGNRQHPTVFETGAQVRQSVATTPNAVGFIKASQVDESVKVVTVDGSSPGQPAYKLKFK